MTSRSLVAAILAAATILTTAAPATAQRYFMRERIVGMPTDAIVYTPTYSSAYGACSNGSQTAPIATCKDPAGKTVANALCGASAQQSPPKICSSYVCGSFAPKGHISGSYATLGIYVRNDADAKVLCEQYAANNGMPGGCMRETYNQQHVYYVFNKTAKDVITASYFDQNVAICSKQ